MFIVNAKYDKVNKVYHLTLENTTHVVTLKKIDENVKHSYIKELHSIKDVASPEIQNVLDKITVDNMRIQFNQLYERTAE